MLNSGSLIITILMFILFIPSSGTLGVKMLST